jgi:hypothetical protein
MSKVKTAAVKHSPSQGFLDYYIFNVRREINTAPLTIFSRTRLK